MIKKYLTLLLFLFSATALYAQQDEKKVYERYLDFNLERFQGNTKGALTMGKALLDSVNLLPQKSRVSFYNSMGKLYEDSDLPERAVPFYEQVTAAVPNYYVAHRALGYIYASQANKVIAKMNAVKPGSPEYLTLRDQYRTIAKKAVQHLEIAQACDPSDDTLGIIKVHYKNMGDTAAIATLDERLAKLGKNCLDILSD
jgi:tetratricopeptide (TPR) repeat protein